MYCQNQGLFPKSFLKVHDNGENDSNFLIFLKKNLKKKINARKNGQQVDEIF